ncbi:MAG: hypothetical protein M5U15_14770 [Kiritimatiellae bacterium]|nr:hypothetical protein [Kiritimatiellia bacterium]
MTTTHLFRAVLQGAVMLFVPAALAVTNDVLDAPSVQMKFDSTSPEIRREAVESILAGKAEEKYALVNADVIELLSRAVADPDAAVRSSAMQAVYGIAYYSVLLNEGGTNTPEYKWAQQVSGGTALIDFAKYVHMRSALLSALNDQDSEIRRLTVAILTTAFPRGPDIEHALVARFEHESADGVRHAIIRALGSCGYSSAHTLSVLSNARVAVTNDTERTMLDDVIKELSSKGRDLLLSPQ